MKIEIQPIRLENRTLAVEILNRFRSQINQLPMDGIFHIKKRFPVKILDIYLKLQGTGKALAIGAFVDGALKAILLGRVEDKPFLQEEQIFYIDLAATAIGQENHGYMSALVAYTENWVCQKQIPSIELRAISANERAVNYWQNRGYLPFYIRFRKNV